MSVANPIRYQKFLNVENQLNQLKTIQLTAKKIMIPVVVHVLHNGGNLGVSVKVVDVYGSVIYADTKIGKQFSIPTAALRNGVYSVVVSDGTNIYQNKLIVKH